MDDPFDQIVRQDCYGLAQYPSGYFTEIIDVGAGQGIFSVYAKMRHPKAKVVAFEPCPELFERLRRSCMLFGIEPEAFSSLGEMSLTEMIGDTVGEKSCYMLKIDCGGGESFLAEGEDDEVVRQAAHVAIAVHPGTEAVSDWLRRFDGQFTAKWSDFGASRICVMERRSR
jgi:hypothetical protein